MRFWKASVLTVAATTMAAAARADDQNNASDDLWLRTPAQIHARATVRHAHQHFHRHAIKADIPHVSLDLSSDYTGYSGPYPSPSLTQSTATLTVTDPARGQLSLQWDKQQSGGQTDNTAAVLVRVPLSDALSLDAAATLSAERAFNPAYQFQVAPTYLLFSGAAGPQWFGQVSVSAEMSRFATADEFSLSPAITLGSRVSGLMLSAGYVVGRLYNADPAATAWSANQASTTTGPTLSLYWSIDPAWSVAMTVMPGSKSEALFSTTVSTLVRVSGSYQFRNGPRLGLALEHADASEDSIFLNRALTIEASLSIGF